MISDYSFRSDIEGRSLKEGRRGLKLLLLVAGTLLVSTSLGWNLISEKGRATPPNHETPILSVTPRTEIPLELPGQTNLEESSRQAAPHSQGPDQNSPGDNLKPETDTGSFTSHRETGTSKSDQIRSVATIEPAVLPDQDVEQSLQSSVAPPIQASPDVTIQEEYVATPKQNTETTPVSEKHKWLEEHVKSGDSLSKIFSRLGLSANLLHRIVNSSKQAKQLARIRPGETLKVKLDDNGQFLGLIHQRTPISSLRILPDGEGFRAKAIERGLETQITQASGIITSSLYEGAKRAGLPDELTMELANIFGWDIDFALEIRAGDRFSMIYEEQYLDGEKYDNGAILAAEFVNRGQVFRAVRYEDGNGNINYYSPDGRSMRKAFLRPPVDFRRISSRFTKSRWHPVLGKKRPHRGVDYAAATGTPIKASGDGRIIFRGKKGGYGNTVIIKHGSQYTTLYAHLSKFNRKAKQGSRVHQGQVIGYVGRSGLASGPHLHYEFRVNGVHRNPLTVKLPAAAPIEKKYLKDFTEKSHPFLAHLDRISETMLAEAQ